MFTEREELSEDTQSSESLQKKRFKLEEKDSTANLGNSGLHSFNILGNFSATLRLSGNLNTFYSISSGTFCSDIQQIARALAQPQRYNTFCTRYLRIRTFPTTWGFLNARHSEDDVGGLKEGSGSGM